MEKQLFHYTKVDSLKLILNSKKIRFNSLSEVDDLEEQFTDDLYDYGKHIFAACFTDCNKESIPTWYMYSKAGQGVRLKFTGNLFDIFSHLHDYKEYKLLVAGSGNVFPVLYTEDEERLYPKVEKEIGGEIGHDITVLGKYKRSAWSFQREWRYALLVYKYIVIYNETLVDVRNVPISYYDVEVKNEVFNNIEITLGYNISNDNREKVKAWVQEFNENNNANITIQESCFLNKIR